MHGVIASIKHKEPNPRVKFWPERQRAFALKSKHHLYNISVATARKCKSRDDVQDRSGISRLLRRAGVAKLQNLQPKEEAEDTAKKTFKD